MKKKIVFLYLFLCVAGIVFARTYSGQILDASEYTYDSWDDFYNWMDKAQKKYTYAVIYEASTRRFYPCPATLESITDSESERFSYTVDYRMLWIVFFNDYSQYYSITANTNNFQIKLFKCSNEKQIINYWDQLLDEM